MDAPGFPDSAGGAYVVVVWCALLALVVLTVAVTVAAVQRGGHRRTKILAGLGLVVVGGVAALALYTPASAVVDPTVEGGPAECPLDAVAGARLIVDHSTRMYTFWRPCETASRVRIGLVLGGDALVSGGVGLAMLRRPTLVR